MDERGWMVVTVAGPRARVNFRVAPSMPIGDLLVHAIPACAGKGGLGWTLHPRGGPVLEDHDTLESAAVPNGWILDLHPAQRGPVPIPVAAAGRGGVARTMAALSAWRGRQP